MLRCLVILLGLSASIMNAFPSVDMEEINQESKDTIEIIIPDSNEIKTFKTIRETKELIEFFTQLRNMRNKKSLSIVGKDSKYIYLVVTDINDSIEDDANSLVPQSAEQRRYRRGLDRIISKPIDLANMSFLRNAAVTVSLFNYLGYLPLRLPGVPYHVDTGSPDKRGYDYVNEFPFVHEHHF